MSSDIAEIKEDQSEVNEPSHELIEAANIISTVTNETEQEQQEVSITAHPAPEYKVIVHEVTEDYELNSPDVACVNVNLESDDFDQLLIEEIRKNRLLWDSTSIDYKEPSKRKQVWNEISRNLDISNVDLLRRKWRYLRDGYTRSLKRRREQEKSGSTFKHPPKCRYFNELQFLSEIIAFDDTDFKVPIPAPSDIIHAQLTPKKIKIEKSPPLAQKRKLSPPQTEILYTQQSVSPSSASKEGKYMEESFVKSSNELFCASLVESLDRMSYKNNRLARIDIMRILTNYEFEVE